MLTYFKCLMLMLVLVTVGGGDSVGVMTVMGNLEMGGDDSVGWGQLGLVTVGVLTVGGDDSWG